MRPPRESRAPVDPAVDARPGKLARWLLFGFFMATLVAMLAIQGFSAHTVGASSTGSGNPGGGIPHPGDRALFAANGPFRLAPIGQPAGKRIALTFDDGPSSQWTPQILRVLQRYQVPATFFLVGTQAAQHPDLVREEHRLGYEIGNHTYTHVDPSTVPGWEAASQVDLTQSVITGLTGVRPRLFRPPYSSTADAVTPGQERAFADIANNGYLIALANHDSEDWTRPGVATIVRNATPAPGQGGIVLMHDAGGNRAETVAAIEILIPRLLARGYRFVPVSDIAGLPRTAVEVPATPLQRTRAQGLVFALHSAAFVTGAFTTIVLGVGILTLLRMLGVAALAARHKRRPRSHDAAFSPPVSIVVPAYNECVDIAKSVGSLAGSDYPDFEVIVVDDGSTDRTPEIVTGLDLERVRVIRQPNRGKAAALNRGIEAAAHDVIVTVDADTVFEPGTLRHLVQPFSDAQVGAVSGNTKVSNRGRLLGRWQHIEYVMGFNLDRRMYELLGCMPTVPGAIGAFRRAALAEVGGISGATLAEDTDVTMAIGRRGWLVVYEESARAYTEVPDTLSGMWRQRYRWAYGTLQSVWKHRGAIRHRSESRIGRRAIPYLALFQIVLPFAAPLIDLFAVYGLIFLDPVPVLAYWVAFNSMQFVLAAYAFRLDHERHRALWALPLQQFVYRQVMYLVVIESVATAFSGIRLPWQHVARTGELEVRADVARHPTRP
jgi:cellulose synthase/poly-beta-1,6-N-acetylglucosamine synthase-like glycosyltransferase/peptidoglycan/xylan/chitin deacetylase (PgdA/CDA1 family)